MEPEEIHNEPIEQVDEPQDVSLDGPFDLTIVLKNGYEYHSIVQSATVKVEHNIVDEISVTGVQDNKTLMYVRMDEIAMIFYTPVEEIPA